MKKGIFLLLPSLLFLVNCSFTAVEPLTPAPEPEQRIITQYLRIGQIKEITVEDFLPGLQATQYLWATDAGAIISQTGRTVILQAPEAAGKLTLQCQQMYEERVLGTTLLNFTIYSQVVVLKADDLIFEDATIFPHNWNKYFELIESRGIKGSAGIIGKSLENAPQAYYDKIRHHHQKGFVEFWNHGYTHELGGINSNGEKYHEFNNSGREFQRSHLERTQTLGKEKTGITFRAFGAPGNQIDEDTQALIEESDDIRLWFYGHPDSRKNILKRTPGCEIEFPVHHPSFDKFKANYRADVNFLVLQFHPTRWSTSQFEEFISIIDYLQSQHVSFMNPIELAKEFYPELLEGTEEIMNIL